MTNGWIAPRAIRATLAQTPRGHTMSDDYQRRSYGDTPVGFGSKPGVVVVDFMVAFTDRKRGLEIATALALSKSTVEKEWMACRAWLRRELSEDRL